MNKKTGIGSTIFGLLCALLVFGYFQGWFTQTKILNITNLAKDCGDGRVITLKQVEYKKPLFRDGEIVVSVDFRNGGTETNFALVGEIDAYQNGVQLSQSGVVGYDEQTRWRSIQNGASVTIKQGFKLSDGNAPVEIQLSGFFGQDPVKETVKIK